MIIAFDNLHCEKLRYFIIVQKMWECLLLIDKKTARFLIQHTKVVKKEGKSTRKGHDSLTLA